MDFNASSAIKNTVQKIKVSPNKKVPFFKLSEKDKPEPLHFFCSQKLFQCIKKKRRQRDSRCLKNIPYPPQKIWTNLTRAFKKTKMLSGLFLKLKRRIPPSDCAPSVFFLYVLEGGGDDTIEPKLIVSDRFSNTGD